MVEGDRTLPSSARGVAGVETRPSSPALADLVGTVVAGRYRVDSILGEGGMGAVFRGHHLALRRDVAIKVLHPELTNNEQISKRFDREAQSASRLEHPNIIEVTDFGETEGGMKFMVMQLLTGHELTDELGSPLEPARAVELMSQILAGLEHAHARGVVHRDLKPENVFVTRDHEGRELLKLVDFGIAKIVSGQGAAEQMTRAGMIFGTPHYMSPEQAKGAAVDARTDVYSAGVMLYQMLAGWVPFMAPDMVGLLRQHIEQPPPPVEDVPRAVADVTLRMLAKRPEDRYHTVGDARAALVDALSRPTEATTTGPPASPRSRRPAAFAAAGAVSILAAVVIVALSPESAPEPGPAVPAVDGPTRPASTAPAEPPPDPGRALEQAGNADRPCTQFRSALAAMLEQPERRYLATLRRVDVPHDEGDPDACAGLAAFQANVLAIHERTFDTGESRRDEAEDGANGSTTRSRRRRSSPIRRIKRAFGR